MSPDIAPAIGAVAFWSFVAIAVVASAVKSADGHRETQKTIRQAIEKGQTLDPATLERLIQSNRPPPPKPADVRRACLFGGIMLLAVGAGLGVIGWAISHNDPNALYPGLGAGALVGLLGVGLLVATLAIREPRADERG
jgi:hypothetical protein